MDGGESAHRSVGAHRNPRLLDPKCCLIQVLGTEYKSFARIHMLLAVEPFHSPELTDLIPGISAECVDGPLLSASSHRE